MSDQTFVDANVLVYAHDVDHPAKREASRVALRQWWTDSTGCLSPKALEELCVTVTRKIASPMTRDDAQSIVAVSSIWCIDLGARDVMSARGATPAFSFPRG